MSVDIWHIVANERRKDAPDVLQTSDNVGQHSPHIVATHHKRSVVGATQLEKPHKVMSKQMMYHSRVKEENATM